MIIQNRFKWSNRIFTENANIAKSNIFVTSDEYCKSTK